MSSPKLRVANYLGDNFTLKELRETSIDVFDNHFKCYCKGTVKDGLRLAIEAKEHNKEVAE